MYIDIKVQTISYWARLLTGKQSNLSFYIYKCMYDFSLGKNINFDGIKFVKMCAYAYGYTYVWETQTFITDIWLDFKINSDNLGYLRFMIRKTV